MSASATPRYEGKHRLAPYFDTQSQQYESHKLGMWIFLVTEVLMFGGLFCAYAIYRAKHPEIFLFADTLLDKNLGALNTIILLFSSFTMAWAVRAAMLGQRQLLIGLLAITLLCAFGFLGVKSIEYTDKWKHGIYWGQNFDYEQVRHYVATKKDAGGHGHGDAGHGETPHGEAGHGEAAPGESGAVEQAAAEVGEEAAAAAMARDEAPAGGAEVRDDLARAAAITVEHGQDPGGIPRNLHIFFGIYFVMTGLHGIHVIAGMVVIGWLLKRAIAGDFGAQNYTAVDLGGLYWHLVDLIWIFLFPLLYLIH